jgi:hypothetical protein
MTVRFLRLTRGIVGRILTLLPTQGASSKSTTDNLRVAHHAVSTFGDSESAGVQGNRIELVDCGQVSRRSRI